MSGANRSDLQRWTNATLALRCAFWREPVIGRWVPVASIQPMDADGQTLSMGPPLWARKAIAKGGEGYTLTTEGGRSGRRRWAAGANRSPAGRIITALETVLGGGDDDGERIAPGLRPASGRTGPGALKFADWRLIMSWAGCHGDWADREDSAMYYRFRRAVARLERMGYFATSVWGEAEAGDSVQVVGAQRETRARPAGLRYRACGRMVEAAKRLDKPCIAADSAPAKRPAVLASWHELARGVDRRAGAGSDAGRHDSGRPGVDV